MENAIYVRRPFSCSAQNERQLAYADESGIVRVYDPVAGYYTTCHSLTEGQVRYVQSRKERIVKKYRIVEEGGQFIGISTHEDAENEFIANLLRSADESGGRATLRDAEGCRVTATLVGDDE